MNPTHTEDRQLLSECFSGDRQAGEMLVQRFSGLIYRTIQQTLNARQIPRTPEDLADLHNTVFVKLFENRYRKLRQYEGKNGCSLATWIRTVTVRIILNEIRKRGMDSLAGQKQAVPIEDIAHLLPDRADTWHLVEESEKTRMVKDAMARMPERDRLFLKLHIERELPVPEVAEIMNITPQNAYTIKHRAIQRLKELVTDRDT